MKHNLSVLGTMTFVLLFLSCSSDDPSDEEKGVDARFVGTWELAEVNVSEPIDTNDDGTTTSNLMTEVDCLRDTMVLTENSTWSSTGVFPQLISPITGNLYNVDCSGVIDRSGNWVSSGNTLNLIGSIQAVLVLSGDRLTLIIGDDLPGLQSLVYAKQ
jgi:hypothetical protein